MAGYSARLENGQVVMDEPLDLPDGTPLRIVVDEGGALDNLSPEEDAELEARLAHGWAQIQAGETYDAEQHARELLARRGR